MPPHKTKAKRQPSWGNTSMETTKPRTTLLMLLPWALLCGATVGSMLPKRELQMLEMMQNLLRVDSADLSGRSQRSVPLLYASSVPCDDSLAEDTSEQLSLFDEDFDSSEECGEYGNPCQDSRPPPSGLEPCPHPLVPRQHPCYVRVMILRTPLMQHDPCTNFTLGMAQPASASANDSSISTTTTPTTTTDDTTAIKGRRQGKRCRSKTRKGKQGLAAVGPTNVGNDTSSSTADPDTNTAVEEITTGIMPTTTPINTTQTTIKINTTESNAISNGTEAIPTTTLMELYTKSTLPPTTTTETSRSGGSRRNQLKSTRGRRRKLKNGGVAGVPDRPKIKLDGAMQPSDARPVFLNTEATELRSRALSTTLRPEAEQTAMPAESETTDCVEDSDDEEATTESGENRARAGQGDDGDSEEDCEEGDYAEDAEDQDTNICPQFSPPEEAGNVRLMPSGSRFRKPVKNYVEPILYEGQFTKPRQRTGMLPPGQRDFYVSNKQIMPRPKLKVREPLPHSIYMNNIVRGLKCSDEADPFGQTAHGSHSSNPVHPANAAHPLNPRHSLHPSHVPDPADSSNRLHPSFPSHPSYSSNFVHPSNRRYHPRQPSSGPRDWPGRRSGPDYGPIAPQPVRPGQQRGRGNPLRSGEDPDCYGHDSDQYYDDDSTDNMPWPRNHPLHPASSTSDPCQAEHSREAERKRQRQRENDRDEHLQDYPHRSAPRFFT